MLRKSLILLLLLASPVPSSAAPIFDADRAALGLGGSYEHVTKTGEPTEDDVAVNLFLAAPLTPMFTLAARGSYSINRQEALFSPGVHYNVGENSGLATALTYDFYINGDQSYENEWVGSALYTRELGEYFQVSAVASYGMDNHELRTSIQVTAPLWVGKDAQ